MQEIELKFQVPPDARGAVDNAVAATVRRPRVRLQAAYYDTADGALAAAGLALRVRREGRTWVQTLKGAGDDGLTRAEHNVPVAMRAAAPLTADPALHAATPVGRRLLALLGPGRELVCVFRTDILRRRREMRTTHGSVELAFDEGHIVAGDRRLPVRELEIELVRGSPLVVIETARRWVARHGLWLDTRSKAERGSLLARGEAMAPPCLQRAPRLARTLSLDEARQCVLLCCMEQVSVNASQVAEGVFGDEHVHQLRIGLRRLRSALELFGGDDADPALAEPAAMLFGELGAARAAAAVSAPLRLELDDALRSIGLVLELPPPFAADANGARPEEVLRGAPAQALLLEGLAQTQAETAPPGPAGAPLRDGLAEVLERWHRDLRRDARRFAELDDVQRHRLRKHAKRLRYASEIAASLYARRPVRRYLKALRGMQDALGLLVDTLTGLAAYTQRAATEPAALFAVGWLAARRERLLRECEPAMAEFIAAKRFWRD
jgi:inorganic triphosphatase YgiF